jgi:dTDP-3-amino-2,3,6-trideoxy-4-keto-D-glucose/dTDP-3-amino-3,4,6-trideoxy-alpha-D-glucose/dTDP-2,6-dideoxy-D-kanosamine transaminase
LPIKVWDYLKEFEEEREDIFEGIEKVFRSGKLILGESVKNFEAEFSKYCQTKYGIGVDNGTDSLFLALKALNVGKDDEVITVTNTAVPTVSAIVSTGAVPVFVDINPETYLMDVDKIERAITKKTKCILPVHLYGQCVDMDPLLEMAGKYGLKVLEDCAQCHGATYKGKKAGSMSDLASFSFYPTKPLGTYGDGGMVITNSEELNKKMRRLRYYGMDTTYYSEEHGYNSRLDEIHAEILLRKLKKLDANIEKRRILARRYDEILKDTALVLPKEPEYNKHVYYIYVVRHPDRDNIMKALADNQIFVNISYPWPIHTMRGYAYLGYKTGDFPIAESAAKEIFSLPMYPYLTFDEQNFVCDVLKKCI